MPKHHQYIDDIKEYIAQHNSALAGTWISIIALGRQWGWWRSANQ
jgi:hypothetical protein